MRQPMNATGWWPRCGMDPGVQHTRSCVTLMRYLERTVPFSRQPHLTRTVQMFAHANVCTKNSPGQGRMMAKCYIMRCAMRSVGEVQRSPNAPHPVCCVARRIEQRCHSLHLTVSWFSSSGFYHFPHTSTRLGVCDGAYRRRSLEQETCQSGSFGCMFGGIDGESGLQSRNECVDFVHLGQAPSLAALRGPFVIYDDRAG